MFGMINPVVCWGLAGAILFSTLVNQYLFTGQPYSIVVGMVVAFAGGLSLMSVMGIWVNPFFGINDDSPGMFGRAETGFPVELLIIVAYVVFGPALYFLAARSGAYVGLEGLGQVLSALVALAPVMGIYVLVVLPMLWNQGRNDEKLQKDAARFVEKIFPDNPAFVNNA